MSSIFGRIINGEIPGTFVWRDERCVGLMTIAPLRPGHTLVIPIEEVDHWVDLADDLRDHVMGVATQIGKAIHQAFEPTRVGLMIAGLEVPHTHLHLVPIDGVHDLDFANADTTAERDDLEAAAARIREVLVAHQASGVSS